MPISTGFLVAIIAGSITIVAAVAFLIKFVVDRSREREPPKHHDRPDVEKGKRRIDNYDEEEEAAEEEYPRHRQEWEDLEEAELFGTHPNPFDTPSSQHSLRHSVIASEVDPHDSDSVYRRPMTYRPNRNTLTSKAIKSYQPKRQRPGEEDEFGYEDDQNFRIPSFDFRRSTHASSPSGQSSTIPASSTSSRLIANSPRRPEIRHSRSLDMERSYELQNKPMTTFRIQKGVMDGASNRARKISRTPANKAGPPMRIQIPSNSYNPTGYDSFHSSKVNSKTPSKNSSKVNSPFLNKHFSYSAENLGIDQPRPKQKQPIKPSALAKNAMADVDTESLKRRSLRGSISQPSLRLHLSHGNIKSRRASIESISVQSEGEEEEASGSEMGDEHYEEASSHLSIPGLELNGLRNSATTAEMALFTSFDVEQADSTFESTDSESECESVESFEFHHGKAPQSPPGKFQFGAPRIVGLPKQRKQMYANLSRGTYQPSGRPTPSPWNSFHND